MASRAPAFQFYPADFVSGRVAGYTAEEIGVYILLLCQDWTVDGLPCEMKKLAIIAKMSAKKFTAIWKTIGEQFVMSDDGKYRNPRLQDERAKQLTWREKSSKGGTNAQARRGHMANHEATSSQPPLVPMGVPIGNTSSSSSSSQEEKREQPVTRRAAPAEAVDERFLACWQLYPKRAGTNSREEAYRTWRARLGAGVDPEIMRLGTERYAAYCVATGKIGTETVMQAVRFFGGGRHYAETWELPRGAPTSGSAFAPKPSKQEIGRQHLADALERRKQERGADGE